MYHLDITFPIKGQVDIRVSSGGSKTGHCEYATKSEAQEKAKFLARSGLSYGYCVALELEGSNGGYHWLEPVRTGDEGFYSPIIGAHVACIIIDELGKDHV